MDRWWQRDVLAAGKLPLMLCFLAFVLTFAITRTITRLIRAGRGPFRNQVTSSGVHVHHAVPGLVLLIVGAFVGVSSQNSDAWTVTSALLVGMGTSLVLDEFALLLHLTDVYWSNEGRVSVDMVSLTAACLGLVLVGVSPVGVTQVGTTELAVRLGGVAVVTLHAVLVLVCVLKSKYRVALFGLFLLPVAAVGATRLGRPRSYWARHRYGSARAERAATRAATFDRRFAPVQRRWENLIGGRPSLPDPPP
ncbi:hypothetical protein SAMN04515671_3421 [Nakamurella panacisegetis]|uniref:Integral membrane protein n=1 Tax=Nakamurella panacisegetis TaxID=1090615 RepID=A0A1H0R6M3_9ACTN|nr:hypothetical protein [Nakamurella panacisegetis]SDP25151.1 hypothetical protein SAMN04515671_3421 [Nakamurella panacisegetis]